MRLLKRLYHFMDRTDGSLQKKAVRSSAWVALSSVVIGVLTFGRGIILARLLTPEIFGLMALCLMATRLIEIFTETGFGAALIQRQDRFEDAKDTAFTMMFLRGIGLAAISYAISPYFANFYHEPVLQPAIAVVGLSFVLSGFTNINMVALQKELDYKRLTYYELTSATFKFLAAAGLAYWLRSLWALVYAQIASAAITSALSFIMVPGRVRFHLDWEIAKQLYRYGRFMTGLAIVVFITRELDNAVVGKVLGVEILGYYVAAYTLATIPSDYISRMIAKVLFPMLAKLQNDFELLRVEYTRGIRLITSVAVPIAVATAVLAPEIVQSLYGAKWSAAAPPLAILSVFGCFRALWLINGYSYNAIGRPHIDFSMNLTRLIVMGALIVPLTMKYGAIGASLAVTLPMAAQFVAGVYLSRRLIGVPITVALRPLGVAAVQGAVLAIVLIAAKSVVSADPRVALVLLGMLSGVVCLALNLRDIRTLFAAYGAR
ncbi:MAG TPA: lipopolysaccharide biosynthesis protein [Vicinamibacterales bacterium]